MITEEESAKIVNFMHDPWGRGFYAKVWPYELYNENKLFL